jgi:hypothetical protein
MRTCLLFAIAQTPPYPNSTLPINIATTIEVCTNMDYEIYLFIPYNGPPPKWGLDSPRKIHKTFRYVKNRNVTYKNRITYINKIFTQSIEQQQKLIIIIARFLRRTPKCYAINICFDRFILTVRFLSASINTLMDG